MKKTLLEIYALLVCLFSLACFALFLGIAVWNCVSIVNPEFTLDNRTWEAHQSDAAYSKYLVEQHKYTSDVKEYRPTQGSDLTFERQSSYAQAIRAESRRALQDFVQKLIILLISMLAFGVHWKIASGARYEER